MDCKSGLEVKHTMYPAFGDVLIIVIKIEQVSTLQVDTSSNPLTFRLVCRVFLRILLKILPDRVRNSYFF